MIKRESYKIDASGRVLGRLASEVAQLLQGKHKPSYVPHQDMGDFVEIKNVDKIKLTGKKWEQKEYFFHSGYLGHDKKIPVRKVFEKDPAEVLRRAVWNMLPKNKLRKPRMKRLKFQ